MLLVLKRIVSMRRFEPTKHMFKLMGKKTITILLFFFLLNWPYELNLLHEKRQLVSLYLSKMDWTLNGCKTLRHVFLQQVPIMVKNNVDQDRAVSFESTLSVIEHLWVSNLKTMPSKFKAP